MKAFVVGGSGYSGAEALRLLVRHPEIESVAASSRQYEKKPISSLHRNLVGVLDDPFVSFDAAKLDADIAFLALPHGESMKHAPALIERGIKVVDLSADYRLPRDVYEEAYAPHASADLIDQAVYGLPELYRKDIKKADLVANPGCYPTSVILGLAPLSEMADRLEVDRIIVDSLSGTSGAGATPAPFLMASEVAGTVKPYKVGVHRHAPEMEVYAEKMLGKKAAIGFTPMLAPFSRGILSVIHVSVSKAVANIKDTFTSHYAGEPFVRVGGDANIKNVVGTNYCDLAVHEDPRTKGLIVLSAIDNLGKGAAGQAVQNMNLMCGFDETRGLGQTAGHP